MSISKWLNANTNELNGKRVAISGSTGGIGRELCFHLSELGASIIMLDRSKDRATKLRDEIIAKNPGTAIDYMRLDLTDFKNVKEISERLSDNPPDYLILNAGAYAIPRKKCDTGYDNVFQINFISPYYLARSLAEKIKERGGRIIAVGSIAHNYSVTDAEDVDFSKRSRASLVYGNAKRYLMYALSEIYGDTGTIAIAHPGITLTNITAHYPKLIYAIIKYPMKLIFPSPKKASLSILRGIFENTEKEEWIGPSVFNVWGLPEKKKLSTASYDERRYIRDKAEEIFASLISEESNN